MNAHKQIVYGVIVQDIPTGNGQVLHDSCRPVIAERNKLANHVLPAHGLACQCLSIEGNDSI
jgi:hypothetical protein